MLHVLSSSSFRLGADPGGRMRAEAPSLMELPRYARDALGVRGLLLPTDFLAGADTPQLDRLRDQADKSACPCLFLLETKRHPLGGRSEKAVEESLARLERVLLAANRLGCSAVGVSIEGPDQDHAAALAAERLKPISARAERLDITLLIRPSPGMLEAPERVTDFIKKIGGFRVGSMPDFHAAAASGDLETYLRRLAPYAPVVIASVGEFGLNGKHEAFSIEACVSSLVSVGYDGAVAFEYRGSGDVCEGVTRLRDIFDEIVEGAQP